MNINHIPGVGRFSQIMGKKLFSKVIIPSTLLAVLSACSSSGSNTVENTLDVSGQNQVVSNQAATGLPQEDEYQDPRAYCPKVVLREGTQTHDVFPSGVKATDEGASSKLRFRATISDVVRECNSASGFINIRVGVRGRFLSGPQAEVGQFQMPVRIAVTRGDEVLYSQLHQVSASLEPGKSNGTFSIVDNAVSIPKPEKKNIIIYAGFDEGPYDTP